MTFWTTRRIAQFVTDAIDSLAQCHHNQFALLDPGLSGSGTTGISFLASLQIRPEEARAMVGRYR